MMKRAPREAFPDDMDPEIVEQLQRRLDAVARAEEVTLPLAVESGSRAWGFPSPDSDYDCRFIYIRRTEDYLSPWRRRDVIETPVDAVYDVNGWDLAKALQLLLKGNAVVLEWLTSPVVYRRDARFAAEFLELATSVVDRRRIRRHYLHLGETQQRRNLADEAAVARKKLFYALRPAAALRWMRLHQNDVAPPMNFLDLIEGCAPPPDVLRIVRELIAEKAASGEMGAAPLDRRLARFIEEELEAERARSDFDESDTKAWAQRLAEDFFIQQLRRSEVGGFG